MKKVVAKTFYSCGIVVPINKKTKVGYREIPETDGHAVDIFFNSLYRLKVILNICL